MAKSKGWIKIERDIVDHWVFQDAEYFRAWMLILLMANHEEKTILINKTPTKLVPGSFHSSISILASKLKWTKQRTLRFLALLETDRMITTKRTSNGTTFFVENWGKYQGVRTADNTARNTADNTADHTAGNTQTRMKKNDEEGEEAQTRTGGRRWKTQAEKSAAVRELAARLDREEREREQRANG